MALFGLFGKRAKLEKQMMEEIKQLAGVTAFPYEDARIISNIISAYNKGNDEISIAIMLLGGTLEKYEGLANGWDEMTRKYKKLGLFPNWKVNF